MSDKVTIVQFPIVDVIIGKRSRKKIRHLDGLSKSMQTIGLLHPIILNSRHELISGRRRLEAAKRLGWKEIPVRIVSTLDDALTALIAERDENQCCDRPPPSDLVALGRRIEELEGPKAKVRQGRPGKVRSGKLPEHTSNGDTRDRVASTLGMSGKSYEKAKAVVEAAEADPEKFGDLTEQMDSTGKIDPVFQELKARKKPVQVPATQTESILREPEEGTCAPGLPSGQPATQNDSLDWKDKLQEQPSLPFFEAENPPSNEGILSSQSSTEQVAKPKPECRNRKSVGVMIANEAIYRLSRIPKNDQQREFGIKKVMDWIRTNYPDIFRPELARTEKQQVEQNPWVSSDFIKAPTTSILNHAIKLAISAERQLSSLLKKREDKRNPDHAAKAIQVLEDIIQSLRG